MDPGNPFPYETFLDVLHEPLQLVDAAALASRRGEGRHNRTLCRVNDSVVRLGVMQGGYHGHKHDNDDELFFVLSGRFVVDIEDRKLRRSRASSSREGSFTARALPSAP